MLNNENIININNDVTIADVISSNTNENILDNLKRSNKKKKVLDKNKLESIGRLLTFCATFLIVIIVLTIITMVSVKGFSTFVVNKVNVFDFLFGMNWAPEQLQIGAFPMIAGSFLVTLFATLLSLPFAMAAAIFMVEISNSTGKKILQPVIELLVGIPSVVYGIIGLSVIVPFMRSIFGGTGFGIISGSLILTIMVLPTITSLIVSAIESVPDYYRQGALALGSTRWQMIYKVVLKSAKSGMLTAIILGMTRAFGEALAVQMVIGNTAILPKSLVEPASTLTSILTMGMGNTIPGQLENNVLWSLALILLLMSMIFIIVIRLIGRKEV